VFLNGNTCADALGMLKAKGKPWSAEFPQS
jgi:hypothetical protein